MNFNINSIRDAAAHFSKYIQDPQLVSRLEGDRGAYCYIWSDAKGEKYYQTFNRTWFFSFSKIFHLPDSGIGQSFKMSMLTQAADQKAWISTVMKEGNVYRMDATEALRYVLANKTFRKPSTETVDEGSVPAKMLHRMDPIR